MQLGGGGGGVLLWPTSTILCLYAHCCSAELPFFSAGTSSALPSISRLCRVLFLLCRAFFSYAFVWALFCSAKHFSPMLITCLIGWALLSSSEHFSAMLSTSWLFQSFLFYAERTFGFSKHFWAMLTEHFFCSAKHFSAMLSTFRFFQGFFRLCKVFFLLCRVFFCSAVYCTA